MASNRPINMDTWGIDGLRQRELKWFCLQYGSKKREAAALLTIKVSTPEPTVYHKSGLELGTFLPRGAGRISDPTAATAARRDRLLNDIRMIEQAAQEAGKLDDGRNIYEQLLLAVTTKMGVEKAMARYENTCPRHKFYEARRKFFWILDKKQNGDLAPMAQLTY